MSELQKAPLDARPNRVLKQSRVVFNAVKTHCQQIEREVGVGGARVCALSIVHASPGVGVGGLAVVLNVRQPTASIIVRSPTQGGLLEARSEGADRRSVQWHLNAKGRAVLRRTPGPFAGAKQLNER